MRRKVLHLSTIINVSPFPTPINLIPKSRFPLTGLAQVPLFKRFTQRFKRDCYVFRRRGRWLVLLLPNNSLSMIRGPYIKEWTHSFLSNDHTNILHFQLANGKLYLTSKCMPGIQYGSSSGLLFCKCKSVLISELSMIYCNWLFTNPPMWHSHETLRGNKKLSRR